LDDALVDEPPVDFELALAGSTQEAEAAALALEVGPGPDQARPLIGEMGQLDLERALVRTRPRAENLEDEPGAVDHRALPGALEVALLHRAHRRVDHGDGGLLALDQLLQPLDLTGTEQRRGSRLVELHHLAAGDVEIDGAGKPDRLLELGLGRTRV